MQGKLLPDSHRKKMPPLGYFEWWYYYFVVDGGPTVNLVLHETDIFGLNKNPYASISILTRAKEALHLSTRLEEFIIKKSDDKKLSFSLAFGEEAKFEVNIKRLIEPLIIKKGVLDKDENGRVSNWTVEVPHGSFVARLEQGRNKQKLSGYCYQDHQWGTLPIQEYISDWMWGHFSNKEISIVFFKILTQKGLVIDRLGIIIGRDRQVYPDFYLNCFDHIITVSRPDLVSLEGKLFPFGYNPILSWKIKPENLMRRRIKETYGKFEASYLRWASVGEVSGNTFMSKLSGVVEYLRIRQ